MTEKVFKELDILIGVRMTTVNQGLEDIRKCLNNNDISLTIPVGGESKDDMGSSLIKVLESLDQFLREYMEIKDTWQVTTA
jgi:hypothetical protein